MKKTSNASRRLYPSPSPLEADERLRIASALETTLLDGLDLYMQIKVAHWNVKGPQFASLHPLFETFAVSLGGFNDAIAERAVTLGLVVRGTARDTATASRVAELPAGKIRDLELVALLAERFEGYLAGVRDTRDIADEADDQDTVDLLTGVIEEFEKHSWFLRATLA
ncbi:MAG: DNA starvation/stationary phase protection protein Dps [Planctomycetes bacterium]|nr:DNA starvation/stationary phase protection protein Dps [Planctomycetota bacterium]